MNIKGYKKNNNNYKDVNGNMRLVMISDYSGQISMVFAGLDAEKASRELKEYGLEIAAVINDFNRKSTEETMMAKSLRKGNQETTNRKTHQENVSNVALRIAKGINSKSKNNRFNLELLDIMARNHDIGHTFSGHSGEWWLSDVKEDYGIGYYCHNALGPRELIYTNKVYDKIIDQIKDADPNISSSKLEKIRNSLWIIMEGINSHNGERSESEYIPNTKKTELDFKLENLYCHTKKGFDKTIMPATKEAALMRLTDKISAIPYDLVDGLREKIIDGLDNEYKTLLKNIGITAEEIQQCENEQDYVPIARKLQTIFIKDVIENSSTDLIKMSKEMSKNMHELRNINNRKIVDYVLLKDDNEIYTKSIREFVKTFMQILKNEDVVLKIDNGHFTKEERENFREKYKNTPYEKFVLYISNTNDDDYEYTKTIVMEATKQSIEDEQKMARNMVMSNIEFRPSKEFAIKDSRIEQYIEYYRNKDLENYTDEQKERDIDVVLNNILNDEKRNPLFLNMNSRIAMELSTKYLSTLNDIEFMELLKATNMINKEQEESLCRKYKDIPDIHHEAFHQANWKEIKEEQSIDM